MIRPLPLLQYFFCLSCAALKNSQVKDEAIAFPGAEGFGKYATGGRGGKVVIVTNLNDNGEGSLRQAVNTSSPKIVVFAVSGTIHLESPLSIKANTTLAGHSAPGDGICLADYPVSISGDNVIIRYMRFRMGDRYQDKGKVAGGGHDDALSSSRRKNIIIDHCSISWSTDEVLSVYSGDSTTIQWNILSEPLNYSYHFEKGDTDFEEHGYGGIMGGRHLSVYYNLFAHCKSRTPRFDGNRNLGGDTEFVDFRNNVIYNWGANNVYGGEGGNYNIIANYYKPGPSTSKNARHRIANPFKKEDQIPYGKWFIQDNVLSSSEEISKDNWKGVSIDKGTEADMETVRQNQSFPSIAFAHKKAEDAFMMVVRSSGASLKRDTLDQRVIKDVETGTGRIIDVQGGFAHGTSYELSKTAWPQLRSETSPADTDKDGMPDAWENSQKLNPGDPADASLKTLHKHYTNIEVYLNELLASSLQVNKI